MKKESEKILVKQTNMFIRYSNQAKFTTNQKKILMYCLGIQNELAKQNNYAEDEYKKLEYLTIDLNDYSNLLYNENIAKNKYNNNNYNRLKADLESIRSKTISIKYLNEKNERIIYITGIFHSVKINENSALITIQWDKNILKDFIKILQQREFTLYKITTFLKINNKYGQRIYELGKSFEGIGEKNNNYFSINYYLNDLYDLLLERDDETKKIVNNSYTKNSYNFIKKVLEPAKKSINNSGVDINFNYKKLDKNTFEFTFNYINSDKKKSLKSKENYERFVKPNKKYLSNKLDPTDDYDKIIMDSVKNKDFK